MLGQVTSLTTGIVLGDAGIDTQCIVGAVTAGGLVGGYKSIGRWFFLRICVGWVIEFFSAIFLSAGIYSLFATPSSPRLEMPRQPTK